MPSLLSSFVNQIIDFLKKQCHLFPIQIKQIKVKDVENPCTFYQMTLQKLQKIDFYHSPQQKQFIPSATYQYLKVIKTKWMLFYKKSKNQVYLDLEFHDTQNFPLVIEKDINMPIVVNQLNKKFSDLHFFYRANNRTMLIRNSCPLMPNQFPKRKVIKKLFGNLQIIVLNHLLKFFVPINQKQSKSVFLLKQFLNTPLYFHNKDIKTLYSSSQGQQDDSTQLSSESQGFYRSYESQKDDIAQRLKCLYQQKKKRQRNKIFSIEIVQWISQPFRPKEIRKQRFQSKIQKVLVSYRTKPTVNYHGNSYNKLLIQTGQIKQYKEVALIVKSPMKKQDSNQYIASSLKSFELERQVLMNKKSINYFPFMLQYYFLCDQTGNSDRQAKHFFMECGSNSLMKNFRQYADYCKNLGSFYSFFEDLCKVSQILYGLFYQQLIHRDFKFANILKKQNGELVIIDFSGLTSSKQQNKAETIQKLKDSKFKNQLLSLSTQYVIPKHREQNQDELVDQLFDVYGFGFMLQCIVSPYKGYSGNLNSISQKKNLIIPQSLSESRLGVIRILEQLAQRCKKPCQERIRPQQVFTVMYLTKKMVKQYEKSYYTFDHSIQESFRFRDAK